jgi:autophagy-related protein 18
MLVLDVMKSSHVLPGLCALSSNDSNCHLAFATSTPGSDSSHEHACLLQLLTPPLLAGEIVIYDALNLSVLNAISAHTSAPTVCAFNPEGTLLATASAKGTVIRIFSVPSGEKLLTLRRGSYPTVIYCIAFSQDSSFVCASSETGRGWYVCTGNPL